MKLVWSPETASKAYIDTVESCELYQESGVAELISAMAAGWNAKLIVETWSHGGVTPTSIGLSIAAGHTSGRHVCLVPDDSSYSSSSSSPATEILAGEAEEVMPELDGIDFLVVDCRRRDFAKVLRLAKLSPRGAVLVCKNAGEKSNKTTPLRWRSVVGDYRVVRTAFLPVGQGLEIAHVAAAGGGSKVGKSKWIKHVDQSSGEEHVIRTT